MTKIAKIGLLIPMVYNYIAQYGFPTAIISPSWATFICFLHNSKTVLRRGKRMPFSIVSDHLLYIAHFISNEKSVGAKSNIYP